MEPDAIIGQVWQSNISKLKVEIIEKCAEIDLYLVKVLQAATRSLIGTELTCYMARLKENWHLVDAPSSVVSWEV